jgi:ATP-dependent RNA helicase DDX18/HAS1
MGFRYSIEKLIMSNFLPLSQKVAASFGFKNPPKVNLDLDSSAAKHRKKMRRVDGGKRHGISASNPYGRKDKGGAGDKRQLARF